MLYRWFSNLLLLSCGWANLNADKSKQRSNVQPPFSDLNANKSVAVLFGERVYGKAQSWCSKKPWTLFGLYVAL